MRDKQNRPTIEIYFSKSLPVSLSFCLSNEGDFSHYCLCWPEQNRTEQRGIYHEDRKKREGREKEDNVNLEHRVFQQYCSVCVCIRICVQPGTDLTGMRWHCFESIDFYTYKTYNEVIGLM